MISFRPGGSILSELQLTDWFVEFFSMFCVLSYVNSLYLQSFVMLFFTSQFSIISFSIDTYGSNFLISYHIRVL